MNIKQKVILIQSLRKKSLQKDLEAKKYNKKT